MSVPSAVILYYYYYFFYSYLTLLSLFHIHPTTSKIIGAAILPHGDFAYDPSLIPLPANYQSLLHKHNHGNNNHHDRIVDLIGHQMQKRREAEQLHNACNVIADWVIHDLQPDLIFVTAPHAMKLAHSFLIFDSEVLSGHAMIGDDLHDKEHFESTRISLSIKSNRRIAHHLMRVLDHRSKYQSQSQSQSQSGHSIESITAFNGGALPLSWSEVIPVKFLENAMRKQKHKNQNKHGIDNEKDNDDNSLLPEFIMLSMPRYAHEFNDNEFVDFGYDIWNVLHDIQSLNILVLISADLSHTHQSWLLSAADAVAMTKSQHNHHNTFPTPVQNMPYGFCHCAQLYDNAIAHWIQSMDADYLLETARMQQQNGAKSCGYHGFLLLQGMFEASVAHAHGHERGAIEWKSELLANSHPSYYGMAVARFIPM